MTHRRIATAALLGSASLLTLSATAHAQSILFSTNAELAAGTQLDTGREVSVASGTVQVRLPGGGVASFVDSAQFSLRQDGSVDLRSGSVTVVGAKDATVSVHMPDGVRGSVAGSGAATFTANASGARGSTTAGTVSVSSNGVTKAFAAGQFWTASSGRAPDRAIAGSAAAVPGTVPVRSIAEGGIVAAAENGIPVALGEGLAGVGARGDVIAAARRIEAYDTDPTIAAFPTGDYALLVQYAAQANGLLGAGGTTFRGAGSDIIRSYFEYLAAGNAGGTFRTAYAQILLNYLDLLRAGVLPSTFRGATQTQLGAYLAFIGRTDGFGSLSAGNRQLLDAYLAFLSTNGSPDAFGASVTNLTTSFLNYVRAGNNPASFTQASASVVSQYLAIVQSGGLRTNLTAQNQALLAAYLANNGIGFTTSYATGLAAFVAYLNAGGLPSGYTALPAATVRGYLETLETTGLFDSVLGAQAAFLRNYLTFLRGGGTADGFNALPINVARVNASNLALYVEYLLAGGAPTAYTTLTQAQIRAALDQLTATGQFNALLGINAAFLGEYYAYIRTGADADTFAGLPNVDVAAYAASLGAFAAYLRAGNLPSGYTALSAQQLRSYLSALQASGKLTLLGGDATLLGDYLAYIRTGGAPDAFGGLPIVTYTGYATALSAYFAYLNAGGLPSGYAALTQAQLRTYLDVLKANGQFTLLGNSATFYANYLTYLADGGAVDGFSGLPSITYAQYGTSLGAFVAFLRGNGLPGAYTTLTSAQIREYLAVLQANDQLGRIGSAADQALLTAYTAYLATGGLPNQFAGLPAFVTYEAALRTYYAFLQGGGKPSAYGALTQAQIVAYIQALDAAGLVTTRLTVAEAKFLRDYAVYVSAGNAADAFAGLPGNQAPTLPVVTQGLANAPRGSTGNLGLASAGKALQTAASTSGNVVLTGNAVSAFSGANGVTTQSAKTVEARTVDGTIAIARVGDGTYNTLVTNSANVNEGVHLVWGTPATAVPTTGTIAYGLVTATQPTVDGGAVAPGSFAGNLAIDLASRRAGWDSVIGIGGVTYRFASDGGTTAPSLLLAANSNTFGGTANTANNGLAGTGAGFLSGTGGAYAGFAYTATAPIGAVTGTAIFGKGQPTATLPAVTYTGAPTGTANLPAPTYAYAAGLATTGLFVRSVSPAAAGSTGTTLTLQSGAAVTRAANGALLTSSNASTQDLTRLTAATTNEIYGDARVAIGRWTDGTYRVGPSSATTRSLSPTQGLHYVQLAPGSFVLPTSGQVNYALLAATQPTFNIGGTGAGVLDAKMALAFGPDVKVALEGTIRMPETTGTVTYAFSTPGGVAGVNARPGQTISTAFNVISLVAPLTGSGLACVATCTLNFDGGFGGSDVNRIGATYYTATTSGTSIQGAAIFTGTAATTPGQPSLGYGYTAGLPTSGLRVQSTLPQPNNQLETIGNDGVTATSAADGTLTTIGSGTGVSYLPITRTSAKSVDVAGNARVVVGRWSDGRVTPRGLAAVDLSANQGYHYALLAPMAFTMPYLGRVDYTLAAATRPTFGSGATLPGVFDASMSILFRSTPLVGLQGTIVMPEAAGAVTYAFTTPGGVATPSYAAEADASRGFFQVRAGMTGTGLACTVNCTLVFTGSVAGADPLAAGGTYRTFGTQSGGGEYLTGAASFTGAWVGGAQTVSTVSNRQFVALAPGNGPLNPSNGSYDIDAAGRVVGLTNGNGLFDRLGSAQIAQSGATANGNLGWTRWSNGSLDLKRLGGVNSVVLNANQGYQILHGAAATALPTSGIVNYTLTGGTNPTDHAGTLAPGTLGTGAAAVSFGATSKVAFDFTTTIAGTAYNLFTTGRIAGVANSEISLTAGVFNNVIGPGGNVTGGSCTGTQCRPIWNGFLAGAGGTEIGLNYQVQNTATQFRFGGVAAFERSAAVAVAATLQNQSIIGLGDAGSLDGRAFGQTGPVAYDAAGKLTAFGRGSAITVQARDIQVLDSGRVADIVGWSRWSNGTTSDANFGPYAANQGLHLVAGTAATNRPAGGTVNYTAIGSTKPTLSDGSAAPGTLTGSMAVTFGGLPKVGLDLKMVVGNYGWTVATNGGVANPGSSELSVNGNNVFGGGLNAVSTTSASCQTQQCFATVAGQLYGDGASHAGMTLSVLYDRANGQIGQANGAIVFGKAP